MLVIPFQDAPAFTEDVELEGVVYRFAFLWNYTGQFWSMTISDTSDRVLIAGVKLVLGYELIHNFPDRGLPPGFLYVIDESESAAPIGYRDFVSSRNLKLIYAEENELV